MNLQGKEYAQVKDRLQEFRKDCPNGLVETSPTIEGNTIMFRARVLKDKSDPTSAEASGHSFGENKGQKAFEKLETIAVGRALALLGYASDGDIASSEEMEEFVAFQEEKRAKMIEDMTARLSRAKNLVEVKKIWAEMPIKARQELETLKEELKKKYENASF